jgi:M6 family metalloprotease-like protein
MKIKLLYVFAMLIVCAWAVSLISCAKDETGKPTEQENTNQEGIMRKGLVILVEYPDVKHSIERDWVKGRYDELNKYIKEMSYNKVYIDVDITEKWYEMPKSVSNYKISSRNLEVDDSKVEAIIQDAIDSVDKDVDFEKYDFNALFMSTKVSEYGMVGLCGYPGMLGWETDKQLKTKSGQVIKNGVAIFCYQAHIGTLFHDTAHILGGVQNGKRMVPCLYDHDLQASAGSAEEAFASALINMGYWDPMSCHYVEHGVPPPGISSWTKLRLNWLDQSKVKIVKLGETAELQLDALEKGKSEILAVKIPITDSTYYLIENRQPIGYDKYLPGSGVLIMFANDNVAECRHGNAPVKLSDADPSVSNLKGAAYDIGKKTSFVDGKNGLRIQLIEKIGDSYKISIGK